MRVLLDTHTLIWGLCEPEKLNVETKKLLINVDNIIFVSVASLWELQIKKSLNKISLPDKFASQLQEHGYELLNITHEHIAKLDDLPMIHRDPFDRMLIAQSIYENIPLITKDAEIVKYNIQIIIP
ncbi:type II toxin-antitoxin system VapC family toxin [Candidatus Trichorickettsia mobilis]|uniref:type II toxin-antitoxin system VapC family toxin n=1 Tax=Candidatus Trichorickettsia mobilis TaxID=1346319 RepID=UPI00292DB0BD|nr:type II toxin-antitoxin system VapC family toxin [Candidatus Trichorickettsia mobilis]